MSSCIRVFLTGLLTLLTAALLALAPVAAKPTSNTVTSESTGFAQNFVGDIKGAEGSPVGVLGHGVVGCLSSDLSGGNCGQGAVSAAAGEIATGWADDAYGGDSDKVKELIRDTVNPTLAALTSGGDLGQFSINQGVNDSQLKNNYLTHADLANLKADYAACKAEEDGCSSRELYEIEKKYQEISDARNAEVKACPDWACVRRHQEQAVSSFDQAFTDPVLSEVFSFGPGGIVNLESATQDEALRNIAARKGHAAHCSAGDTACIDKATGEFLLAAMDYVPIAGEIKGVVDCGTSLEAGACSGAVLGALGPVSDLGNLVFKSGKRFFKIGENGKQVEISGPEAPKGTDGVLVGDGYVPSGPAIIRDGTVRLDRAFVTKNGERIPAGSVITENGGAIKIVKPDGQQITGKTNNLLGSQQLALPPPAPNRTLTQIDTPVDLTNGRSGHILANHRAGAGKAGKTEFPSNWDDQRIIHQVSDISTDPTLTRQVDPRGTPYVSGTRDGLDITVTFFSDSHPRAGQISSAYPTNVPKNPRP